MRSFALAGAHRTLAAWRVALATCFLLATLVLYPAAIRPGMGSVRSDSTASRSSGGSGGSGDAQQPEVHWFKPRGYQLPQECVKHAPLYTTIFDNLRPWRGRGITRADLDACAPIASTADPTGYADSFKFRLLVHDNEVLITSPGLRRGVPEHPHMFEGLEYYQIKQIQDAARRFGLPNMEFAVGFDDLSQNRQPDKNGGLCPLMIYCKSPEHFDILIPDGQFTHHMYDQWLEKYRTVRADPPWEQKDARAVGRFTEYCAVAPQHDRHGHAEPCIRTAYLNHSIDSNHKFTSVVREAMNLTEQHRTFKYSLHTDGIGCANRLQKVLATGQVVIKQDSNLTEFYSAALRPWVHYVPVGFEGLDEVDWAVQFLRENDDLAHAIGENGRQFAHQHLNLEGRLCYIKVLFEEMRKLMRYETPRPEDFPYTISYDEEVKTYVDPHPNNMGLAPIT